MIYSKYKLNSSMIEKLIEYCLIYSNIIIREWNTHISRMNEDRIVRRVRDNVPIGRRSRVPPMKRWSDALENTDP